MSRRKQFRLLAAKYYGFAAERGHPEAKLNRARCMRLLGRWDPLDRSSESVSHSPSPDCLTEVFRPFLENPRPLYDDGRRLLRSLQRMKAAAAAPVIRPPTAAPWVSNEVKRVVHPSCALRWIQNQIPSS
jgi:TPR repeat protein